MRAESGPYPASQVAAACQGTIVSGDPDSSFDSISTDSRNIRKNDLFVPLVGDTYDGHSFLLPALDAGARGSLVERDIDREILKHHSNPVLIQVQDTLHCLSDLASSHRKIYPFPLIAVTGSSGKTTVKEMIATVLGRSHRPLVSEGNFNNMIGLPMTVLKLGKHHNVAVVEAGINRTGEMEHLARAAAPDVAVITTVGPVHLEGLGTVENVAREKFKLVEALPRTGTAILPAGDPYLQRLAKDCPAQVLTVGLEQGDFRAKNIRSEERTFFDMECPYGKFSISLSIAGVHNILNSLASAAACFAVGASGDQIVEALGQFMAPKWRMETLTMSGNRVLIRDCYNANPQSMSAALKTLVSEGAGGKTMALLADMRELGDQSEALHEELGREAAELSIDRAVFVGEHRHAFGKGFTAVCSKPEALTLAAHKDEAWDSIKYGIGEFKAVLVKGSRAMEMETIADLILQES